MGYTSTTPKPGDNKIVLLKKILQAWGGAIPNGPLNEREILRLLLVRIGVTVPNGPHTDAELLALLLAAFQGGGDCPLVSDNALVATIPAQTSLDDDGITALITFLAGLSGEVYIQSLTELSTLGVDFLLVNQFGITGLHFSNLATIEGGGIFELDALNDLTILSFPALTFADASFDLANNPALVTVNMPSLTSITDQITLDASPVATLNLNALTSWFTGGFSASDTLVTIDLRSLTDDFSGQFQTDINGNTQTNLVSVNLASLGVLSDELSFAGSTNLTTLNLSSLTSATEITLSQTALTSLNLPLLATVDTITATNMPALTTVNMPLAEVSAQLAFANNSLLTSVVIPQALFQNGLVVDFSGCALDGTSVNLILARCVASPGVTSGLIDLTGGDNAAPTGQGILDRDALALAGVTVNTN